MYADVMSDSMKLAIEETNRRRKIQQEFNQKYGVEPVSVVKEIRDNISIKGEIIKEDGSLEKLTKKQIEKEIQRLETLMKQAAKDLDFEKAMELRDLIFELKAAYNMGTTWNLDDLYKGFDESYQRLNKLDSLVKEQIEFLESNFK